MADLGRDSGTATAADRYFVVGVDGSEASIAALRWAEHYASLLGAELRVITAFDIPWTIYITPTATDELYRGRARDLLETSITKAFPDGAKVPISEHVVQSRPSIALTAAAKGAMLLVIGATGHGAVPDMRIGSVATACAHHAPCPVVIHRSSM